MSSIAKKNTWSFSLIWMPFCLEQEYNQSFSTGTNRISFWIAQIYIAIVLLSLEKTNRAMITMQPRT